MKSAVGPCKSTILVIVIVLKNENAMNWVHLYVTKISVMYISKNYMQQHHGNDLSENSKFHIVK